MDDTSGRYVRRENAWDEGWPSTGAEAAEHPASEPDNLDEEAPFPETVGTEDSLQSVRDAEPYMAPIDPPVLPGGSEGIQTTIGFGTSTAEEAYGEPLPRGDEDIHDEALNALRHDSLTSRLPLDVEVSEGVVRLVGEVESIEDADYASDLIGSLPGVVDVVDDTTLQPV